LFLKINNKCELIDFKRWSSQPIFYPHFSIYSKKLYKEYFFFPMQFSQFTIVLYILFWVTSFYKSK
jgi:hypothetical protein